MKKFFLLILIIPVSINVFGADFSLSAGGGGLFSYTFTRYAIEGGNEKSSQNMDRINYAGFLFFDATYAEFSVLIHGGSSTYMERIANDKEPSRGNGYETNLGLSLMGKYPLIISEKFCWFPMIGIEYQIALMQKRMPEDTDLVYDRAEGELPEDRDKNDNPYPLSAWNSLWINIGAGMDYFITNSLFLRGELIFGFRLPTAYENGALDLFKKQTNDQNPKLSGLTGGPSLKIGIGYRF